MTTETLQLITAIGTWATNLLLLGMIVAAWRWLRRDPNTSTSRERPQRFARFSTHPPPTNPRPPPPPPPQRPSR